MFISKELLIQSAAFFDQSLSSEEIERFDIYAKELVKCNQKVNLTAITDPDDIVIKHFADSLALLKFFPISSKTSFADVGTGAGFPGIPMLIVNPSLFLTLFDAVNKKLEFIRFLLNQLDLSAEVVHMRAEDAGKTPEYREKFDFVSARAVAELRILSEFCLPLVKKNGYFLSMKGAISIEEKQFGYASFEKLGAKLYDDIFYHIPNGDERNLIIAKKISHLSPKYPRNMSQISKKPL